MPSPSSSSKKTIVIGNSKTKPRRNAAETEATILSAAISEFSKHGLKGARVDAIAELTNTTKRMIYYYFGSKEGLWEAALTESYRRIHGIYTSIDITNLHPIDALRQVVRVPVDHFKKYNEDISLVVFENSLGGENGRELSETIKALTTSIIPLIEHILEKGREQGVFRDDDKAPSALDVHQVITSMIYFRRTNQHTFRQSFGRDMLGTAESPYIREMIEDAVLRYVIKDPQFLEETTE